MNILNKYNFFTYDEINKLVQKLPNYLNLYPVGSYIRQKSYIHDLDIVTTNNLLEVCNWFKKYFTITNIKGNGAHRLDFTIKYNNKFLDINLWYGSKKQLPYLLFAYSYPGDFMRNLRHIAKSRGLKLSQYDFLDKNGKSIKINKFNDVFNILGVKFRTPVEQQLKEDSN